MSLSLIIWAALVIPLYNSFFFNHFGMKAIKDNKKESPAALPEMAINKYTCVSVVQG